MVDIHTHILPGMDDGAPTAQIALEMLQEQAAQGVTAVVLTPHFYREREEVASFLARRERAMAQLQAAIDALPAQQREQLPQLILGAEVAWRPNMKQWEDIDQLCIGSTRNMLLELPTIKWTDQVVNTIYNLLNMGITPVLAHLERYFYPQRRTALEHIFSMGIPIQISAGSLQRPIGGCRLVRFMGRARNAVLASDCHSRNHRPPNMAEGVARLQQKLEQKTVEKILDCGRQLILPE